MKEGGGRGKRRGEQLNNICNQCSLWWSEEKVNPYASAVQSARGSSRPNSRCQAVPCLVGGAVEKCLSVGIISKGQYCVVEREDGR